MLPNLCLADEDKGAGDWNELLTMKVEGLPSFGEASCMLSEVFSILSSTLDTGEGTKNLGLAPPAGLIEGIEGDWNKFAWFPPPWLKVSTYLAKNQ